MNSPVPVPRHLERGIAHLFITVVIFVLLVGAVGFAGYNAWKRTAIDAGTTGSTCGEVKNQRPISLTFATWNMRFDNPNNSKSNNVATIVTKQSKELASADIVGIQEVHEKSQRTFLRETALDSPSIGVFPHAGGGKFQDYNSYPIVYDQKKLKLIVECSGTELLGKSPDIYRDKWMAYARFQVKETKQEFYYVNTHLLRDVEKGGKPSDKKAYTDAYKVMMKKLTDKLKKLPKSVPVLVGGDFAVNFRDDRLCTVSWWPCQSLRNVGLKNVFESTNLDKISSTQNTYGKGDRIIDYIFASGANTSVTSSTILNDGAEKNGFKGSDHKPVVAKVTLGLAQAETK